MKVLVVSSYALLGGSLAYMLQSLLADETAGATDVVTCCITYEAVDCVRAMQPDMIVIEAVTSIPAAIAAARAIAQIEMHTPILMLGADDDAFLTFWTILAGADGYLPKDVSPATLVATVRGMARGELGLSRTTSLAVVRRLRHTLALQPKRKPKPTANGEFESQLTKREREIFALVRRGRRSREIAVELCIAEATVYKHIQNVMSKLRVHTRAHAVLLEESDVRIGPISARTLKATVGE